MEFMYGPQGQTIKKNVFIIGAGFSKPLDFPLAKNIFEYLGKKSLPEFLLGRTPDFCKYISIFCPQIKPTEDFSELIKDLIQCEKENTFEQIILKFDAWLQVSKLLNDKEDNEIRLLKNFLLRWMTYCFDEQTKKSEKHQQWNSILKFTEKFGSDSWFITLNYDNLLERAFYKLGHASYETLPISKIHGSIDWWKLDIKSEPGHLEYFETLATNEKCKIVRIKTLEYPDISSDMGYSDAFGFPYIVPLTPYKNYEPLLIRDKIKKAAELLREVENVYIIGSSISSELGLAELLRFSNYRRSQKQISWIIIDPNATNLERSLQQNIGLNNIECICEKWETWLESI
jgi:NAD-dependent SIR2 family protein deacetylase